MAGELIRRPKDQIEPWVQPDMVPAPRPELPPWPYVEPAPQVQAVYIVPEESGLLNGITADLSRPFAMLIWGAVLVGIYLSGWWMLAAGFAKIGMLVFGALFVTAPHARKYLLMAGALLLAAAFAMALMRGPERPAIPETKAAGQAPVVKAAPQTKARKRHPPVADEKR